jgi:integrator complex subunit 2
VVLRVVEGLRKSGGSMLVVLVMPMILQILASYMTSARRHIMTMQPVGGKVDEAELSTLILAQDSAVIQMLLEVCLGDEVVNDEEQEAGLEEIRGRVCTFIHQVFIEQPLLAKLVHFQGYHFSLVPIIVAHVPSMHICLGWLVELLNQPQHDKQVFAIYLAGYLVEKYPLPLSLPIAKTILAHIKLISQTWEWNWIEHNQSTPKQHQAIVVLPSIVKLCAAFPMLLEDALIILLDMTTVCPSVSIATYVNNTFAELFMLLSTTK